jgi:hypothetical protein
MTTTGWTRSTFCSDSNCVEVGQDGDQVLMRDSKHPDTAPLAFTRDEWAAFLEGAKAGEFDA